MYVKNPPSQAIGQVVQPPNPSWMRDILVTTAAIVIGTAVVGKLRKKGFL